MLDETWVIINDSNQMLWSLTGMAEVSTVLKALCVLSDLIHTAILWERYFYYTHFRDEEIDTKRLRNRHEVTQPGNSWPSVLPPLTESKSSNATQ